MFVLGCLPPYEHVCVCLSVRAYVAECIVCACKHERVRESVCASPSVCLSACIFVRPNVCSYMRAFINACVRVFACARA